MLVEIQPGKEKEFGDEILAKGFLVDSKVERMDFVHGPYDFVLILSGTMENIDSRLMEMRKSPYVRKTETLICFEMFESPGHQRSGERTVLTSARDEAIPLLGNPSEISRTHRDARSSAKIL